jgi:hypothetical protein
VNLSRGLRVATGSIRAEKEGTQGCGPMLVLWTTEPKEIWHLLAQPAHGRIWAAVSTRYFFLQDGDCRASKSLQAW